MANKYLSCTVAIGMLDNEYAVVFESADGPVSAFILQSKVQTLNGVPAGDAEVAGKLLVELLDESEHEGLIQLPVALVNGSDVVKVSNDLLSET